MITQAIDFVLHLNVHLANLVASIGNWSYVVLFAIIFAETGLVILPFLPGDSLLFAAGSLAAISSLNPHVLVIILIIAAFTGNLVNYLIGRWFGHLLFTNPHSKIFRQQYLTQAHVFYEKYGATAVIISRFIPIVRTFVPFVAGMAEMSYARFILFNAIGAISWIALLTYAGFFFGQVPFIKQHFSWVVIGIIVISILPMVIEFIKYLIKRD